ncbi:VanZ family protein [Paenibacillus humicola]|uniref:VanZ family protein n=1 Tax=Paenibacillus humicola TaxID=3110540 RepID=UPI00237B7B00|nr:VanZ family protein [Paenibacillus humicola]
MNQTGVKPSRRALRFIPAVLVMAAIFTLSAQSGSELNTFLPWFQKLFPAMQSFDWAHFIAYFVLAAAFDFGFGRQGDRWTVKLLIVLLSGLYGLTDEYHQSFVAGRTPDPADILHDCIGAALAVLIAAVPFVRERWRRLAK